MKWQQKTTDEPHKQNSLQAMNQFVKVIIHLQENEMKEEEPLGIATACCVSLHLGYHVGDHKMEDGLPRVQIFLGKLAVEELFQRLPVRVCCLTKRD